MSQQCSYVKNLSRYFLSFLFLPSLRKQVVLVPLFRRKHAEINGMKFILKQKEMKKKKKKERKRKQNKTKTNLEKKMDGIIFNQYFKE